MKRAVVILCLFAAAQTSAAVARDNKPVISLTFQGEWYPEPQICTGDIPMDGIRISGTMLEYGEDYGDVLKVRILNRTRIRVYTADFGEMTPGDPGDPAAGHHWTIFSLGNRGQALQETTRVDGKPYVYTFVRCHEADRSADSVN